MKYIRTKDENNLIIDLTNMQLPYHLTDEYIDFNMDIGNGYNIVITYYVVNNKGIRITYSFGNEIFLDASGDTVVGKTLDLRKYNLKFKINLSQITTDQLFNKYYNHFQLKHRQ